MEIKRFKNLSVVGEFIFDLVKLVAIAYAVVWLLHHFVFQPFMVNGPSMEPNFYDKDYLIVEEVSQHFNHFNRGEVIIFHPPYNPKDCLIKRIVALPDERITIDSGKIRIFNNYYPQGIELDESIYLPAGLTTTSKIDIQLAADEYYVLGDNRNVSLDSRIFGPIKEKSIIGRPLFRGWPLREFGFIKIPNFAY